MGAIAKTDKTSAVLCFLLLIVPALALTVTIAYYKIAALYLWMYPGDVALFDQILAETLKGNFGVEFAFGKFGCHYYLFLLLLLPLKILLGNQMPVLLVVLPVIFYFIASGIVFLTLQSITKNPRLSLVSSFLLLLAPNIFGGLYSLYHGTQLLDDLSGFIAVLFVLFIFAYQNSGKKHFNILSWFFYILFMTLSEEFVLLGSVYFLLNTLFYKNKNYLIIFAVSLFVFAVQIIFRDNFFITLNWNMYDVGVKSLVSMLHFREHLQFLQSVSMVLLIEYAGTISALICIFLVLIAKAGKINMVIAGLFVMGLMKCGLGYILQDVNLRTWHNFPGVLMMTGALSLQIAEQKGCARIPYALNCTLLGLFALCFVCREIPFLQEKSRECAARKEYVVQRKADLIKIINTMGPEKISIAPEETKVECIFNDYWRFMRIKKNRIDLDAPPAWVDYLVVSYEENRQLFHALERSERTSAGEELSGIISSDFQLVSRNRHYVLFERVSITDTDRADRTFYFNALGLCDPAPL